MKTFVIFSGFSSCDFLKLFTQLCHAAFGGSYMTSFNLISFCMTSRVLDYFCSKCFFPLEIVSLLLHCR